MNSVSNEDFRCSINGPKFINNLLKMKFARTYSLTLDNDKVNLFLSSLSSIKSGSINSSLNVWVRTCSYSPQCKLLRFAESPKRDREGYLFISRECIVLRICCVVLWRSINKNCNLIIIPYLLKLLNAINIETNRQHNPPMNCEWKNSIINYRFFLLSLKYLSICRFN